MSNILKIIKSSNHSYKERYGINEDENYEDRKYNITEWTNFDEEYFSELYYFLKYIKENLGNRPDTLNNFLDPLIEKYDWNELLFNLDEFQKGSHIFQEDNLETKHIPTLHEFLKDKNLHILPDLLSNDFSEIIPLIQRFVEIFININRTLNSKYAGGWAVTCRFDTWDRPMRFMDSRNFYDLDTSDLSFGQCSVIVLETLFAKASFLNKYRNKFNKNTQSCLIVDEPEIGRSEHWVSLAIDRILELSEELEGPPGSGLGDIYNESFTIVSHKERLLRSLTPENNYHVMQFINEFEGEEE